MLGLKSAPKEKVHGATALTPTEWRELLASKRGTYFVKGGRPRENPEHVSRPVSRWDAQYIFDAVIDQCDFAAEPGWSVRIVARDR